MAVVAGSEGCMDKAGRGIIQPKKMGYKVTAKEATWTELN